MTRIPSLPVAINAFHTVDFHIFYLGPEKIEF